jgi:hypothetical protein
MTGEKKIEVPNLDALDPEELEVVADELGVIHPLLRTYAVHKARAMRLRALGGITTAQHLERQLDITYASLPEELRW